MTTRLAVWGDPVEHSRSPELHAAAYAALGLEWSYGRRRVDAAGFRSALETLDNAWRGLSLTMPLKEAAFRAAATRDRRAELTGAVNTLRFDSGAARGFNTDVGGIVRSVREFALDSIGRARIVGAGATAASAVAAFGELGVEDVEIVARRPERIRPLADLGERAGVAVAARAFGSEYHDVDLTIATLPGGAELPGEKVDPLAASGGLLFDVAYSPWPSRLARSWTARGASAQSGLSMLLNQAVLQVRIFVTGDPATALDDEPSVVAAMRAALMGD